MVPYSEEIFLSQEQAEDDQWWERRALKQSWGFCHPEQSGTSAKWVPRLSYLQPSDTYENLATNIGIPWTAFVRCIALYMESCKHSHQRMWAQLFSTNFSPWKMELKNTATWAMWTLFDLCGEWAKWGEQASLTPQYHSEGGHKQAQCHWLVLPGPTLWSWLAVSDHTLMLKCPEVPTSRAFLKHPSPRVPLAHDLQELFLTHGPPVLPCKAAWCQQLPYGDFPPTVLVPSPPPHPQKFMKGNPTSASIFSSPLSLSGSADDDKDSEILDSILLQGWNQGTGAWRLNPMCFSDCADLLVRGLENKDLPIYLCLLEIVLFLKSQLLFFQLKYSSSRSTMLPAMFWKRILYKLNAGGQQ